MKKGVFIVFEGIEGSGKSTQAKMLYKFLKNEGKDVVLTREPGATSWGKIIRSMLLDPKESLKHPSSELLLFTVDRLEHIETVIKPALKKGVHVICDRYIESTYAYQYGGRKHNLEEINYFIGLSTLRADLTILLDLDPEIGLKRAKSRAALDRFEQETLAFHHRVRNTYLARAKASKLPFFTLSSDTHNISILHEKIKDLTTDFF